jgi:hypothetical protein
MNDEFKKLDQLVQRNIPNSSGALRKLSLPQENSRWVKSWVLTASLVLVVLVTQNQSQFNQTEDLVALEDVMSWDLTADESVSEIDDVMEFIDI